MVGPQQKIPPVDLIILPGSKNVRADLTFLREQGWDAGIARHLRYGGKVIGICGGLQMLGESVADPLGIEDVPGTIAGLGYLALRTYLTEHKVLQNRTGFLWDGVTPVAGGEIHCGVSDGSALKNPALFLDRNAEGCISDDDQIFGTYVHGLFDHARACNELLRWAGLSSTVEHTSGAVDINQLREEALNRLGDVVEQHLQMDSVPGMERCANSRK